ncbi:hypothetical protein KUTeg_015042 [Tegillarca granosa]|uniref:G-protein coupled receptors family 1 profile domain-containing protein n=1 Tax=Tegillarca granosa TaxID=220873 RepID=A0ABQ9EUH6_TEGGR|nr:hypothetical protein KUTeg_015042 [Tegillarca granosa]
MLNVTADNKILKSGYDLPVTGLENCQFYNVHIPAMSCVASYKIFFSWTKSERFVMYLAVCDGLFNIAHTLDHAQIAITRSHELCEFYGFMLAQFITAQNLMVSIVAINAFVLIFCGKDLNFRKADWERR